jgi:type I restriction enzyme S subunit
VDSLLTALDTLIAKKRLIKQGAMQELLTGKKRLRGFSGEWKVRNLGDLANIIMGQSPDSRYYNYESIGVPLIQGNADIQNRFTIQRVWTTQITKSCSKGDLILTVRAPVGAVGIATENSCVGRGVCALLPANIDRDFLYHALVFRENDWKALEQGSTFTSANSKQIGEFPVSVSTSVKEQTSIAEILSNMDAEITALEARRQKTSLLKQGMMQELLTGRIRLV